MSDTYRKVSVKSFMRALSARGCNSCPFLQFGILTSLYQANAGLVSIDNLAEWIYGDDPEGGPEYAQGCIRSTIHRLRKRHIPIKCYRDRGYVLERAS